MANKYANLVGIDKIKDEYTKINTGFDGVETDINTLDARVDTIITTPIEGAAAAQEIVDARVSAVKEKTFATLDARFEETEQDIATHKADNVTDVDGAHGLKIEVGTFTPELKFGGNNVGLTYTTRIGYFVRIGDFVHVECSILLSNKGSSVGDARVSGFPFASLTTNPGAILGPVRADYMNLPVNMVNLTFALVGADGLLIASINNANRTLLNDTHFSNNTLINLNGDYRR